MTENDSQNKNENETQNMNENETQNMNENGISNTIPQASGAEIPNAVTADDTSEPGKIRSIIPDKFKIFTSAHLKWIAIITMFIDHLTATMLEQAPWADFSGNSLRSVMIIVADLILRGIGRIAFPIFIFMMVEGLFYTRSKWKYLSRMAIFALISHIPFNMAFFLTNREILDGKIFTLEHTSVFMTLFLGMFALVMFELIREKLKIHKVFKIMMTIPIGLACMITAQILNTDYGAWGVIAIMSCYLVSLFLRKWNGVRFSAAVVPLMLSNFFECLAFLGLPALLFYGGKKGKNLNKWFFYFFYPVHLLLLALLRLLVYGA